MTELAKYSIKKALVTAGLSFMGIFYVHLLDGSVGSVNSMHFWDHTVKTAFCSSLLTELQYLIKWGKAFVGNGNGT